MLTHAANNPAPIRDDTHSVQGYGYLGLTYQAHEFPMCHDHRGSRDPAASVVTRQSWLSHRQPKSAKAKTRTVQKETFGKRDKGVQGGKVL